MAVIALTSARGAPGVSTTALAMTLLWPRSALLAECDPAGGSSTLTGYLRGGVEHTRGLLGLAVAHRHSQLGETVLWSETLPLADGPGGSGPSGRWLLPGLSDAAQAPSTAGLWGPLGGVLAGLERAGTDVLVDAGRLGAAHGPMPLLRSADVVLLVLGTSLPAVAAARARLGVLREDLGETDGPGPGPLGLLLVGAPRRAAPAPRSPAGHPTGTQGADPRRRRRLHTPPWPGCTPSDCPTPSGSPSRTPRPTSSPGSPTARGPRPTTATARSAPARGSPSSPACSTSPPGRRGCA
jgi:hypothetical protein